MLSGHFLSSDVSLLTAREFPTFIWRAYHANCPCFRAEEAEAGRQNNLFKCKHVDQLWIRFKFPGLARWIPALLLLAYKYFVATPVMLFFLTAVHSRTVCEILTSDWASQCKTFKCLFQMPLASQSREEMHLYDKDKTNDRKQLCNQSLCYFSV